MAGSGYGRVLLFRYGQHGACPALVASISLSSHVTKPLPAIPLLLPLVACTLGREGLEGNRSESPNAVQNRFCLIGERMKPKANLERRFETAQNGGAADRIGAERRSLGDKKKLCFDIQKKRHP